MSNAPGEWVEAALAGLPPEILQASGSVFYSGRGAFEGHRRLYLLGLNPGGSPVRQKTETVAWHLEKWRRLPASWSEYVTEQWDGKPAGSHGIQPRIRRMFEGLGMDLHDVPASNVIFVRSTDETALAADKTALLDHCWPVHDAVIRQLGVDTILCLGGTAGRWVREKIGAHRLIEDGFTEQNARGWKSKAHIADDGRAVISVTHPGRADWRNPAADPTPFVRRVLDRAE